MHGAPELERGLARRRFATHDVAEDQSTEHDDSDRRDEAASVRAQEPSPNKPDAEPRRDERTKCDSHSAKCLHAIPPLVVDCRACMLVGQVPSGGPKGGAFGDTHGGGAQGAAQRSPSWGDAVRRCRLRQRLRVAGKCLTSGGPKRALRRRRDLCGSVRPGRGQWGVEGEGPRSRSLLTVDFWRQGQQPPPPEGLDDIRQQRERRCGRQARHEQGQPDADPRLAGQQ